MQQKAIVDTCLLHKLSADGKNPDYIKKVIDNLGYNPLAHKYVAEQEFELHGYLKKLLDEGFIEVVEYEEFLDSDFSRKLYEQQFIDIYNELRDYLKNKGGTKQMPELRIPTGHTIYDYHMHGSSMGDVHMILMASFMRLPVFLSEDSDIALLRDIAKRRLSISSYQLNIYNTMDLLRLIAVNSNADISHKEFENIVKQTGERSNWKDLNSIWNENHLKG